MMNAVLMAILFIGALKHPDEKESQRQEHIQLEEGKNADAPGSNSLDSIDRLLDEYVIKKEKENERVSPKEVTKIEPDFVKIKETLDKGKHEIATPLQEFKASHEAQTTQKMQEIAVEPGDSLDKISRKYGVCIQEIMKINHLNSSTLQIGQVLYIPKVSQEKSLAQERRYYVVRSGDSPWTIAAKHNLKLQELLKLNNLNDSSAKKLKPGCRLRIR